MSKQLTHFDQHGQAHMVDVAGKKKTKRIARATGCISMDAPTFQLIASASASKGDVLGVARIAAIQASKRTAELIPLCHPLDLTRVDVEFKLKPEDNAVECIVTTETVGRTGVEMEALTAASVALLTVYDMCKASNHGMVISDIRLLEKQGGRSGHWQSTEI